MISTALLFATLAVVDVPAAQPRQQFSTCLRSFMTAKINDRMPAADFDAALAAACAPQEAAYRAAYITAARRQGDSQTVAERDVRVEVEDLRTNFRELFHNSFEE
jgi:hypothetical protein